MNISPSQSIKYILIPLSFLGVVFSGCNINPYNKIEFETEYQAVLLDNGQLYFGKLSNIESAYPLLMDIFYYVHDKPDPETKVMRNLLMMRGNEWHKPTAMRINAKHIVVIETVAPDSKVAQLIKETKQRSGEIK